MLVIHGKMMSSSVAHDCLTNIKNLKIAGDSLAASNDKIIQKVELIHMEHYSLIN